jgi:hypothetical protein
MASFRADWKWNAEGVKLHSFRTFLEKRGFDFYKEMLEIRIHEDGAWDFQSRPFPEPTPPPQKKPKAY